jgi:hypothetical protein
MLFWQSIEDSDNPASFEAYLAQYPSGAFAALARVKINELKRTRTASLSPPSFTVEALDETLVVLRSANAREFPTASSSKVGNLKSGTEVEVTGKTRFEGKAWYRVALSGRAAYVFGTFLGAKPIQKTVVWSSKLLPKSTAGRTEIVSELGLKLAPFSKALAKWFRLDAASEGAMIVDVERESNAREKGHRPGTLVVEINQEKVASPAVFAAEVEEAREFGRRSVLLLVNQGGDFCFVAVIVPR